jgi:hypothetical protein
LWVNNFGTAKPSVGSGGAVEESMIDVMAAKEFAHSPPMGFSLPLRPNPKLRLSITARSRLGTPEAWDEALIDWSSGEAVKNRSVEASSLAHGKFDSDREPFHASSFESAFDTIMSSLGLNEEIPLAMVVEMELVVGR